ncbi:MAG TPA: hypothetical protein VLT87_26570 [Thermoanaerobaculia bacterium]|nr:hypothetical protein [Thermoanaerobaculia bacterium]
MKKNLALREVASLNRAAFRVGIQDLENGSLEDLLAKVVGGQFDQSSATCTEFTCNLYAPPPPVS